MTNAEALKFAEESSDFGEVNKIAQMTNADRIRSMTDEELAERLQEDFCPEDHGSCDENCELCWLRWLQQPADHYREVGKTVEEEKAMTDRERKLTFLLVTSRHLTLAENRTYEGAAKDLIANGVTVQKWVPVTERLPDEGEMVLVIASGKPRENVTLDRAYELAEHDREGWWLETFPAWTGANVTHWMPLPEPPQDGGSA